MSSRGHFKAAGIGIVCGEWYFGRMASPRARFVILVFPALMISLSVLYARAEPPLRAANGVGREATCTTPPPSSQVSLPADDTYHPGAAPEWFFWAGHLVSPNGERFGFHLVFVRGDGPAGSGSIEGVSAGITDVGRHAHYGVVDYGPVSPPAPGTVRLSRAGQSATTSGDAASVTMSLGGVGIEIQARSTETPVFGFDGGAWSPSPVQRMYEIVRPRLAASGWVTRDGRRMPVTGELIATHDWGDAPQVLHYNWDWFAIHLDDGRTVTVWEIRLAEGGPVEWFTGAISGSDCTTTVLQAEDVRAVPTGYWTRPRGDCTYPIGWHIQIPTAGLDLTLQPYVDDQQIDPTPVPLSAWEGDSQVIDSKTGNRLGESYTELMAYCAT